MVFEYPAEVPENDRLAYLVVYLGRSVGRVIHKMEAAGKDQAKRELRLIKGSIVVAVFGDLFDYGLLTVRHEPGLVSVGWHRDPACGMHIPCRCLVAAGMAQEMPWLVLSRLQDLAGGKIPPRFSRPEPFHLPPWRQLMYLGWFSQVCSSTPVVCTERTILLHGVAVLAENLTLSDVTIRRRKGDLTAGSTAIAVNRQVLEAAIDLLPDGTRQRCRDRLLHAPMVRATYTSRALKGPRRI